MQFPNIEFKLCLGLHMRRTEASCITRVGSISLIIPLPRSKPLVLACFVTNGGPLMFDASHATSTADSLSNCCAPISHSHILGPLATNSSLPFHKSNNRNEEKSIYLFYRHKFVDSYPYLEMGVTS